MFRPSVPSDLGIMAKELALKVFCVFLLNSACFFAIFRLAFTIFYLLFILSLSCFAIENGVGFAVFVLKIAAEKYTYARREGRN